MTSMILDNAASGGQLEELRKNIESAHKALPQWTAGEVLGALVDCRLGRYEEARRELKPLLEKHADQYISSNVYWIVGEELENHAATHDLAYVVYETSLAQASEDLNIRFQFDYGPASRLVGLYERDHRLEDARRILLNLDKTQPSDSSIGYPVDYLKQMRLQSLGNAAAKLLNLGFAADAVLLYNQAIALTAEIAPDAPQYFVDQQGAAHLYNDGLTRALLAVTPGELASSLTRMLADETAPETKGPAAAVGRTANPSHRKADEPFLNMMLLAHPRTLRQSSIAQPDGRGDRRRSHEI